MLNFLKIMTEHNIEDVALENILNAKLAQMISCRGVKFRQFRHSKPQSVCYMAMCFLSSGSFKSLTPKLINEHLIPFIKYDVEKKIDYYKNQYYELNCQKSGDKKADKENEKIVNEYLNTIDSRYDLDIGNATFTGLYKIAEQIAKIGTGAISLCIDEFADFISSVVAGDLSNKELYESFKGLSDGDIMPKKIAGEIRHNIDNMPVSVYLATDYTRLKEPKINQYFIASLQSGFARRCFVYISNGKDKNKSNWREKAKALEQVQDIQEYLKNIYYAIPENIIYDFSDDAQNLIQKYKDKCTDEFNKLREKNLILATEIEGSFWKITKLAVIKHTLNNPINPLIGVESVQEAINFYERLKPCLKIVLETKEDSPEDKLKQWILGQDEPFKSGDIKKLGLVKSRGFKLWLEDVIYDIAEDIKIEKGWSLVDYNGFGGNSKAYQLIKKGKKDV